VTATHPATAAVAPRTGVLSFVRRAVVVGAVYAVARTIALEIAVVSGAPAPNEPLASFVFELMAGIVIGVWLGATARLLAGTARRQVVALATLIFLSILAVLIEGAAFQPTAVPLATLPVGALLQLGVAVITALLIVRLFGSRVTAIPVPSVTHRSAWSWSWRYLASAATYVVLYFVTGAINYSLVTRPYYESHVGGLVVPEPGTVLAVALLESLIFPLAVLPLLYALPASRRRRALLAGAALFVLGGLIPLLISTSLPIFLRSTSAVEIFFQKFPAGAAAALLIGPEDWQPQ
jgi:hypothetical protein